MKDIYIYVNLNNLPVAWNMNLWYCMFVSVLDNLLAHAVCMSAN